MKHLLVLASLVTASCAAFCQATPIGDPPVRTAVIPTQRVGNLVVRGAISPTWNVPAESTGGLLAANSPSTIPPVPTRAGTEPVTPPPLRLNSKEWHERIDFLQGQIEAKQRELSEAQAAEMAAIQSEQREAEEQIRRSQALVEQLRAKQAKQLALTAPPPVEKAVAPEAQPADAAATKGLAAVPSPAPVTPSLVFQLRRDDRTIGAALTRWAEEAGYGFQWEIGDQPASFAFQSSKEFPDAVDAVIKALNAAGVDAHMCNYTNRVVRIINKDEKCLKDPEQAPTTQAGA